MRYFNFNAARTTSLMSDVTKPVLMQVRQISTVYYDSPLPQANHPISQNYFLFIPASVMFQESENFWVEPVASRTVSVKSTGSG